MSFLSPARLARASARHPWRVLGAWLVVLVLAVMSASSLGDALTTTSNFSGKPDSAVGEQLLKDRMRGEKPATETIIVRSETMTVDDPSFKAIVEKTSSDVLARCFVELRAGESATRTVDLSGDEHPRFPPGDYTVAVTWCNLERGAGGDEADRGACGRVLARARQDRLEGQDRALLQAVIRRRVAGVAAS